MVQRAKETYKIGGPAPEGHARQCQSKSMHTRNRCRQWALKERNYCAFHGGRTSRGPGTNRLPRLYSKILGGTMQETMDALLDESPAEQVSLFEELALTRTLCANAVQLYAAAQTTNNDETKALAAVCMQEALRFVQSMCESAAKIESGSKDQYTVHQVQHVANQITKCAHEAFGMKDEEGVKHFAELIRTKVRMPRTDSEGTMLTPDQDVTEMDETIPKE